MVKEKNAMRFYQVQGCILPNKYTFQGLDKEMLEPMRPLVTALQGMLVEVYFGFQKIEEIIKCYADLDACTRKVLVYQKWQEGLKNVHVFAVDKEIEKTTQQSQLHSTGNEQWQYHSLG